MSTHIVKIGAKYYRVRANTIAYVHDPGTHTPRLCLSLSICITLVVSLLFPVPFRYKILSCDTSAQIPHDICNSISCVINYVCHSFCLTSFWCFLAVARPQGYFTPKGVFLSCFIATGFFELPGLAGGFRYTKTQPRMWLGFYGRG